MYVDCDLGQGQVTVPGNLSATPIDRLCLSVESGFEQTTPLSFFMGRKSPDGDAKLYSELVRKLAASVLGRMSAVPHAAASGFVVNTMGWVEKEGYALLLETIAAFRADVVVVLGGDRLFMKLKADVSGPQWLKWPPAGTEGTVVLQLPRSGGIVTRTRPKRSAARDARIREYFYGPPLDLDKRLTPQILELPVEEVTLVQLTAPNISELTRPAGQEASSLPPVWATLHNVSEDLNGTLLGVSFAQDAEAVPDQPVAGYVHV